MNVMFKRILFLALVIAVYSSMLGCSAKNDSIVKYNSYIDDERQETSEDKVTIESWVGNYTYSEFIEPDQNMFYSIVIFNENDAYCAEISIDGFQRLERLNAIVQGDGNSIELVFKEYLPDNIMEFYEEGDILLSFKKSDLGIITSWGKIQPIIQANIGSVGVYFKEIE